MSLALSDADRLLISVVGRELEVLAQSSPNPRSPLAMASQLLPTVCGPDPRAAADRSRILDPVAVADYLAFRELIPPGSRVELSRTALGFSKDTYLVGLSDGAEARKPRLVLRLDLRASAVRSTVADEFPLLRQVFGTGFPVAEPLLLETDKSYFGRPFIVMRAVEGEAGHEVGTGCAEEGRAIGLELARLMGRMHALHPDELSGWRAPAPSPRAELAQYFRWWWSVWEEVGRGEFPEVDQAYRYLVDVPFAPGRAALVHGDVDFHNILVAGGRISALLDWEFAHWGDPAEDLGYCRRPVERRMEWEEFLEAYAAAGGDAVSEERIRFYDFWRMVRTATTCAIARQSFETAANNDLRMAFAGRVLLREWVDRVNKASADFF